MGDSSIRVQRHCRRTVGSWCSAETHVYAPGCQRLQNPELLGNLKGRIVGQHNPGAADSYLIGTRSNCCHKYFRRSTDNSVTVVMFGYPVAVKAGTVTVLGQLKGFANCI